ncbi:MAG: carboxypeptidase-like regulatory domain-containing protein [Gemmatimonadota bacterium]|nr:carboxypeptidase-like regulatory domain-containing protein [Gemmatimonadota bacterium]MDH3367851.1 carboxypeptidase-like regulatory domain-containing protein [Gemmatimonadota bacterium]MDH3478794.1 carboxypeptidase-like regulatory domain-containing protein [Gemmatimonadota bacterium]MDH3568881.1 carboxypeptidase-like regulatory domain-containing protein [Gemmatimonadota bacterium]MDH5548319.1 carboxypeptidase-like regulatory domain-containing protein [Gemmatimonadota bacterium]
MTVLVGAVAAGPAWAQVGFTTDILTGVVVDPAGAPLADVLVEAVSLDTEIARSSRIDGSGRFTILFPDGGGQYRMSAKAIGFAPREAVLIRYADEDRLVWGVQMTSQAVMLDAVEVQGRAQINPVRVPERPTPGTTERSFTTDLVTRLPIDAEDLNVLATLVPGVVPIDATDSTGAAFSIAGQRADANAITLDGLTFNAGSVPQEAIRNTRIVTNTYDVSRGRFSGGLIATTTRGGTN